MSARTTHCDHWALLSIVMMGGESQPVAEGGRKRVGHPVRASRTDGAGEVSGREERDGNRKEKLKGVRKRMKREKKRAREGRKE